MEKIAKQLVLLLFLLWPQSVSQTVGVPLQNPSFEQRSTLTGAGDCGNEYRYGIPGWQVQVVPDSGGAGLALELLEPNPCHLPAPPDGSTVVRAQNTTVYQDTGIKASVLQAPNNDGLYLLKFYVTNYFNGYPGYYEAKISLGSQEVCSTDGWATTNWNQITLTCLAPKYIVFASWPYPASGPVDPNAHLIVSLSASGWDLLFDDVSLTFTAQP